MNPNGQPTEPRAAAKVAGHPGHQTKRNLVALGSAAVLAIYAAGFLRTASAAQRLATMERKHLPAPDRSALRAVAAAPAALPPPRPPAVEKSAPPAPAAPAVVAAAVPVGPSATVTPPPAAVAPAPLPAAPVEAPAVPAATPAPVPIAAVVAAVATPAAPVAPAAAKPAFKDGIFYGWGHCRHGDLQASVEIKDGRIVTSAISQCFTRYSQSVIAALPPEVVERQSNNVDWVSGATESSDAFFYAVGEALKQAK
ncbi:MAG: FMN-binding protein [Pseudomonadota bacterium]